MSSFVSDVKPLVNAYDSSTRKRVAQQKCRLSKHDLALRTSSALHIKVKLVKCCRHKSFNANELASVKIQ